MRIHHILIGGLAAPLAFASMVNAADLAPANFAYPDAGLAVATDTWTGFYVGAHLGGVTTNDFSEETTAWSGGVHAGYLYQLNDMFVLGGEIDGSLNNELSYVLTPDAGLNQNWSVAAKARGGIAFGDTLIYNFVGAQLAELEGYGNTTSEKDNFAGLVFGAGVEQKLGDNFSVRAEYQQTRYFGIDSAVSGVGRTDDLVNHAITLGASYHF